MKIKKRYRLIVTDESRLQDVWSLRLTTRRGILLSVGVVLAAVVLAAVLIMVTPLRSLLPGYMKEHQRADFIEALLKLDSLQNEYDRNQAFLRNRLRHRPRSDRLGLYDQARLCECGRHHHADKRRRAGVYQDDEGA